MDQTNNTTYISEPAELLKSTQILPSPEELLLTTIPKNTNLGRRILDSYYTIGFMTALTVYALFSDDLRMLFTSLSADSGFFAMATVCMFFFSLEIVLSLVVKTEYRVSFSFALDVMSTVSLITDIGWVWDAIMGIQDSAGGNQSAQNASSASQSASRASRIVRIVRLFRLIRLAKLYKHAKTAMSSSDQKVEIPEESKVGRRLSDRTIKRVILLVFGLLVTLPLFDLDMFLDAPTSFQQGLEMINKEYGRSGFLEVFFLYVSYHADSYRPLLYLSLTSPDYTVYWTAGKSTITNLRVAEMVYAVEGNLVAIFDIRNDTRLAAGLSIIQTCYICIVLTIAAVLFTRDANRLVIIPIEKMILMVKRMIENPLSVEKVVDVYDLEALKRHKEVSVYEMKVIEETLFRIGALMAIGFGEAGKEIIAQNLSQGASVNVMIHGTRVQALFGFCDIRNFTDTTEVLQEQVMTFVNEIAQVVHTIVDQHLGSANKNIGDAFLLVWKYAQNEENHGEETIRMDLRYRNAAHLADLALLSFIKILAHISSHTSILRYNNHPGLNLRMPNYAVRIGCGLHSGWAIEGAIGSDYKIDPSYLSPNVNTASRLEAATKQYGVPLLLSGAAYIQLSPPVQQVCRLLDKVTVKGSADPIELFTCNIDLGILTIVKKKLKNKEESCIKKKVLMEKIRRGIEPGALFLKSKVLNSMRNSEKSKFEETFKDGVEAYLKGDWGVGRKMLESALEIKLKDGPCDALLQFMREHAFQAPTDWSGYRILTEK